MTDSEFKVDFFCVGVAKAGTTTLHDLLSLQDNLSLPERKETNYFSFGINGRPTFNGPLDHSSVNDPTVTSLDDYRKDFDLTKTGLIGEICPSYFISGVAKTLHEHNPDAKIVILLREPVNRAYSNYQHLVRDGREHGSFEQALDAEADRLASNWEWFWGLRRNSLYFECVKEYVETFGRDSVKIVFFEEFVKNQERHVRDIMEFIGADVKEVRHTDISANKSGLVSGKWKSIHKLLLSEGVVNSTLRTLIPPALRKKLGQSFKALTAVKGNVSDETRHTLENEFSNDLTRLRSFIGYEGDSWLGENNVS